MVIVETAPINRGEEQIASYVYDVLYSKVNSSDYNVQLKTRLGLFSDHDCQSVTFDRTNEQTTLDA